VGGELLGAGVGILEYSACVDVSGRVGIKEAVAAAVQFANSVLPPARTDDIRLEEVEAGDYKGQDVWLITLSMEGQNAMQILTGRLGRDFKQFAVNKDTGEVLSMKIRQLAAIECSMPSV
jgi:hypothetical protein